MHPYALSSILTLAVSVGTAYAQSSTDTGFIPLASKNIPYNQIPYQVDPDDGTRGPQQGYNICNSTTENQQSWCQTSYLNSIEDFCLWAPPTGLSTIGDSEGEEVAWCTKPGRGTRVIPPGALTGVQFIRAPDYISVVGFIDQTKINLQANDSGGELDPHGADLRGNPIGGLVYSTAWSSDNTTFEQVTEWNNFMGGGQFCFKACNPAGAHAADFCQNIYDLIGCAYNIPNNAQNDSFTSCDGDDQDYPGVYTDSAGVVQTWSQPPESLGPITSIPYQPRVPASSNCQTFSSAQLYAAAATDSVFSSTATPTSSSGSKSPSRVSGSTNPTATGGSSSGATSNVVVPVVSVFGAAFAAILFA